MKLAIVGSVKAVEKDGFPGALASVLEHFKPSIVVLTPNARFNATVREICAKKGVPVDEMKPPKPTWMGNCTIGERKQKCRDLRGYYVASRTDALVVFSKQDKPGMAYRAVLAAMHSEGKPIYHHVVF